MEGSQKYTICVTFFVLFFTTEVYCQANNGFDLFVYALNWPYTGCWTVKRYAPNKQCNLPDTARWTIHGLWPSRFGIWGPENCDRSLKFNAQNVAPIDSQLRREWIPNDAAKPHEIFWKYEWEKHGTCSVNIPQVGTQEKYFTTCLQLQKNYNLGELLTKANIQLGHSYNVQIYLDGLFQVLGKRPFVACVSNPSTSEFYLHEIRLCFDKQLQLIDCDGISSFPTNCNRKSLVLYPNRIPGV